ncbi:MAG: histone deacetylase family protein [Gammaproteobacteria bacterium]
MTTGFIYSDSFLQHDTGSGHPECPARLQAIMSHLQSRPLYQVLQPYPASPAMPELIAANHNPAYMQRAERACLSGQPFLDSPDVAICEQSYSIALLAAGATLTLADNIMQQHIHNGFALVRPPGHHAERDQALGFCLFNNVAILARQLQAGYGLDKIVILDWDVHHGNGTQHTFEDDPSVLYISTHQYPYYPGTGARSETGTGRGNGATLNCPMSAGSGDDEYEAAFTDIILPRIDAFKPEFIIISAGFDAHRDDPLGQINLTTAFFGWMTARILELADKHCAGRVLSVLEGGYHLQALSLCVAEHLRVMTGEQP